jgi:NAD(P)-dependent dehydrogenase (short-subunit alcohol dehydrogenase family)
MISSVVSNGMYVILGASGNTGSIIADSLLLKGEKVRVVGRDARRLERFARKGAEAFTADLSDAAALINAGVLAPLEPRSPENTTPTSFERFVQDVFAPAYHGKAPSA